MVRGVNWINQPRNWCVMIFFLVGLPTCIIAQSQETVKSQSIAEEELITKLIQSVSDLQSSVRAILDSHQKLVTPHLWDKITSRASAVSYFANPKLALSMYQVALIIADQLKDNKRLAATHQKIGITYSQLGNIKSAINSLLESKKAFEVDGSELDLIYVLGELGSLYFYAEEYKLAKIYSEQSIELANKAQKDNDVNNSVPYKYGLAVSLSTLGAFGHREGNYIQAIEYYQRSILLYQELDKIGLRNDLNLSDNYLSLGRVYRLAADPILALILYNKALNLARKSPNRYILANTLNSFGVLYLSQDDYLKASIYFNQSLQTYLSQHHQNEVAMVLSNLGVVNQRQGNLDQALDYFTRAGQKAEEYQDQETLITSKEGIGAIYRIKGKHKEALEILDSGLALAKELEDKTRIAEILWRKAEVFYDTGDYSESARLSEESLKMAQQLRFFNLSCYAATLLGKSQLAQNKTDLAFATLTKAIEQIEDMRERVVGQEYERQLFFENKLTPYHTLVDMLVKQNNGFDALLYAERAKGRALLDVLRKGRVNITKAMTRQEMEEEQRLNKLIIGLNNRMRDELSKQSSDDSQITQIKTQLDSARLSYASFENVLYASHPELKSQRGQTPPLTSERLKSLTQSPDTAFVEYLVTPRNLYTFLVTKTDLKIHVTSINEDDLARRVKKLHQSIAEQDLLFRSSSRELYELLLKPVELYLQGKTTICIIPDGILWDLPFQALQSNAGKYVIEDHAIYYAPSLSILMEMIQRGKAGSRVNDGALLAFGNPTVGAETVKQLKEQQRGEMFESLPDAEIEVRTMARIFGRTRSKVLTGADANEKIFKSLGTTYKTIHFATHGVLDNRHPLYSYLLLSKGEGEDDGLLEAREIMNLDLPAEMAVLSACETARGRIGSGEGVIGMSWAFFVAGCRTTVVSQWKVDSAGTSELMVHFYRALLEPKGQGRRTKSDAMRLAAIKLMKDGRYQHPFYWAGFVIVGSDR